MTGPWWYCWSCGNPLGQFDRERNCLALPDGNTYVMIELPITRRCERCAEIQTLERRGWAVHAA